MLAKQVSPPQVVTWYSAFELRQYFKVALSCCCSLFTFAWLDDEVCPCMCGVNVHCTTVLSRNAYLMRYNGECRLQQSMVHFLGRLLPNHLSSAGNAIISGLPTSASGRRSARLSQVPKQSIVLYALRYLHLVLCSTTVRTSLPPMQLVHKACKSLRS